MGLEEEAASFNMAEQQEHAKAVAVFDLIVELAAEFAKVAPKPESVDRTRHGLRNEVELILLV